jgi:hypothetical protein
MPTATATTVLRIEHAELCSGCADLLPAGTSVVVEPGGDVSCLACVEDRAAALRLVRTDPWSIVDDADLRSRLTHRTPTRYLARTA